MLHTETMKRVFKHMGVELVFEYPFVQKHGGIINTIVSL